MSLSFAILLADSPRGRAYIQGMCAGGCVPTEVILMPGEWESIQSLTEDERHRVDFDIQESVRDTLDRYGIGWTSCPTRDVNAASTVELVRRLSSEVVVFAGPSGQLLKRDILSQGKAFLHAHPGRLPDYRGSTTIYYAMLEEGCCAVAVIVFDETIDTGSVVLQQTFDQPARLNVDTLYDPDIRARAMVAALLMIRQQGVMTATEQRGQQLPYYVIHPVLKHVALLGAGAWA